MIRIVDILKKAEGGEGPEKPAVPAEKLAKPEELPALYDRLFAALIKVTGGSGPAPEISRAGEDIAAAIAALVERPAGENETLLKGLQRRQEDKTLVHAVTMALNAIRIGRDANFKREQLAGLALAALARGGNNKLLTEILGQQADLNAAAYQNIINLAEIYEHRGES